MKNRIIAIFVILNSVLTLSAQPDLPSKVSAKKPEILTKTLFKQKDLDAEICSGTRWGQKKKTVDMFWMAYSDRDNNVAYMQPTGNERSPLTLAFHQKVIIADIKSDRALVYLDNKMAHYPDIPSYAKSIGWVPMENLLLWNQCPTDDRGVQKKALIAIKLNITDERSNLKGRLYLSPDDVKGTEDLDMDMNFYFVMKETPDGEMALLCRNPNLALEGVNLYGWVKRQFYTPWNQRTCLEPNWNPTFVEKHKDQMADIYVNKNLDDGNKVTSWKFGQSNGDKDHYSEYRFPGTQLRFPILDKPENNAVLCTAFADRRGSANNVGKYSEVNNDINKLERQWHHMNIILVVEATREMKDYFPAIREALNTCKSFSNQELTVKVGLVLYRGAETSINSSDIVPLTNPDDTRLQQMLNDSHADGVLTGSDRSVAIGQAILAASDMRKMSFDPNERNLLLIVGNRGPAEDDETLKMQETTNRLVKNNIQMMSIQVQRNEMGSWGRYTDQVNDLIINNIKDQYKEIAADFSFGQLPEHDGYRFSSKKKAKDTGKAMSVWFAAIRHNNIVGEKLTAMKVKKYVEEGINLFGANTRTFLMTADQALNDVDFYPELVKKILGKSYENWCQLKAISAYDGYAKLKGYNDNDDYWHYILYLSSSEFEDLLRKLSNVNEAAERQSKDRTIYLDAMKALLKAQLPEKGEREIENLSADEIEEAIYGLNVPTASMRSKWSMKDIGNSSVVKNDEYFEILDQFSTKYKRLRDIKSDYKYKLMVKNSYYYWIPIEDLP